MSDRKTPYQDGIIIPLGVAASTEIEAGKMCARNADGYAVPASDTADLVVMGRSDEAVDNSSGGNGDKTVKVRRKKAFKFENSATHAVTVANIGEDVYVEDAETVSTDGGDNSIVAGKCLGVDSADGQVWVEID
ncbi:MAG: hypothetical protein PVG49_17510 [Desulfobacteraceae bacterium]|jgi:hypothetical protein